MTCFDAVVSFEPVVTFHAVVSFYAVVRSGAVVSFTAVVSFVAVASFGAVVSFGCNDSKSLTVIRCQEDKIFVVGSFCAESSGVTVASFLELVMVDDLVAGATR